MIVLLLSLLVSSSLYGHAVVNGCSYINCHAQPVKRASHEHPENITSSSTNWCGYVSALNLNQMVPHSVMKVQGSWTVPNLKASAMDTSCSIWVGIDGAGSPSVEQIGTEHDVKNGVASHYAWYEMFPAPSNMIVGFPVESGDQITASVTYIALSTVFPSSSDLFVLQIYNMTKRVYTIVPLVTTQLMQRVCAEWIVEAPWLNVTLPLSNFGSVGLFNCSTVMNGIEGAINNSAWQFENMNMISPTNVSKAVAGPLSADGKSFSVQWNHNLL